MKDVVQDGPTGSLAPAAFEYPVAPDFTLRVALRFERNRQPAVAAVPYRPVETPPQGAAGLPPNLDLLMDIDLPLTVRFGETEMPIQALVAPRPGIDHRPGPIARRAGGRPGQRQGNCSR